MQSEKLLLTHSHTHSALVVLNGDRSNQLLEDLNRVVSTKSIDSKSLNWTI